MAAPPTQPDLRETFRAQVLLWSQSGELIPVIAGARWSQPDDIQITAPRNAVRPSSKQRRFSLGDTEWPELGLHSYPYPCLICVLEGEADIRIGVAPEKSKTNNGVARKQGVCVFSLPVKSCLIVPPGVPYSDGKTPHWERPQPEIAHSQILWLQILPTGAIIHICHTDGTSHTHSSALFIKDAQLAVLMQFMLEKAAPAPQADGVLRAYLTTLLLCVDRNWASGRVIDSENMAHFTVASEQRDNANTVSSDSHGAALERACLYIQSHLTDAMTPAQISHHAYVSVPQLKRIFRARLNTPVMKYVTQRRIEEAKTLLQGTGLTIQEIGEICGYPHRTHFSRVFKEQTGSSPNLFRRLHAIETATKHPANQSS